VNRNWQIGIHIRKIHGRRAPVRRYAGDASAYYGVVCYNNNNNNNRISIPPLVVIDYDY